MDRRTFLKSILAVSAVGLAGVPVVAAKPGPIVEYPPEFMTGLSPAPREFLPLWRTTRYDFGPTSIVDSINVESGTYPSNWCVKRVSGNAIEIEFMQAEFYPVSEIALIPKKMEDRLVASDMRWIEREMAKRGSP